MAEKIRQQMQNISLGINNEIVTLPLDLCDEAIQYNRETGESEETKPSCNDDYITAIVGSR